MILGIPSAKSVQGALSTQEEVADNSGTSLVLLTPYTKSS